MPKFSEKTIANIVTLCGVGFWPKAPGTWGSLVVIAVALALYGLNGLRLMLEISTKIFETTGVVLMVFTPFLSFGLGWWATKRYQAFTGKQDATEIVIDEVAGQSLTLLLSVLPWVQIAVYGYADDEQMMLGWIFSSFILFRFFDMLKPWPICWADRAWKGGFGVMFDDILAGIMAAGSMWLVVWLWLS